MMPSQSQTERRGKLLFLLLCMGACLPMSMAQSNQPPLSQERPIWAVKAKQVGYKSSMFRNFRPTVGGDRVKIQFLDDQRLALAWLTPDETGAKLIGPATNVPSHLHLTILDAHTGQQISKHEWPCSSVGVNLACTASGQWLLSSDKTVTLYSPSFDKVRDLQNARTETFHTFISPSGRTFLTYVADSRGARSAQLRDSATFEVVDSWNDARVAEAFLAYSDHFILAQVTKPRTPPQLYVREIGGSWKPCAVAVQDSLLARGSTYGFINDDTLVSFRRNELVLETVGGTELFSSTVPEAGLFLPTWSKPATSKGGERFALILDRLRGPRNEKLDMYFPSEDRVVVYSIPQRGVVFSVKVKGESPWAALAPWAALVPSHLVGNRIALSPDGQLLGIVSDGGVRVYALPPAEQEKR